MRYASSVQYSPLLKSLLLALGWLILSQSGANALSFAPGTEFLPYKTAKACRAHGGSFTKWYGETYCTREKRPRKIRTYKQCVAAGGIMPKIYPPQCRINGKIFRAKTAKKPRSRTAILNIAARKKDCWGLVKRRCLLVNGKLFYDPIIGFKHRRGTRYQIKVRVIDLTRIPGYVIPQDASSKRYELIKVLKRRRVF